MVSIHAPVWGANPLFPPLGILGAFQSTHPCGVRKFTHQLRQATKCFNPRTRVGCETHQLKRHRQRQFQSTHPCGVRRILWQKTSTRYGFNPRTRVGCEAAGAISQQEFNRFNPRTRVGCEAASDVSHFRHLGFNPRTRVGCEH